MICKVFMQGREHVACRLSWWCDGHSNDAKEDKSCAIAKVFFYKPHGGVAK